MYLVMLHWVTELTRARAAFSWAVTGLLGLPYDHGLGSLLDSTYQHLWAYVDRKSVVQAVAYSLLGMETFLNWQA